MQLVSKPAERRPIVSLAPNHETSLSWNLSLAHYIYDCAIKSKYHNLYLFV